jgi:hypothetical protein
MAYAPWILALALVMMAAEWLRPGRLWPRVA